ncbi:MAG TPA: FHA domain-containing serine/threonine-protein kinase [Vicinamibacteria bacterium]|nr:FHA domain-containing serine/threonine-protein kinase [Vicinamibacteria bacterium]
MAATVALVVTAGPLRGRRFEFTGHDTFLFGRAADCHGRLAADDVSASRHHFLLEVNPPQARLRDLGSLNGTRVNGVRHGGRAADESPRPAAQRAGAEVDLRHGDEVRVGATVIAVEVAGAPPAPPPAAMPEAEDSEPLLGPGANVGPYVVERPLGRGAMGVVYLARAGSPEAAPVALKLMRAEASLDEAAREMFLREIEVTRALRHPNIVRLHGVGRHGRQFYFALDYCAGGSVEALRHDYGGSLAVEAVLRIAGDAVAGLAYAHERGFVHRDIKPENVLLSEEGTARLADFGLAKSFEQAGLSGLTATGAIGGTLAFMPREQLTAFREVRPVSDVWSMAATLYFLLTGCHVRDGSPEEDPLAVILRGAVVPVRERDPAVPAALAAVLDRALADDAGWRYQHGGELLRALAAVR